VEGEYEGVKKAHIIYVLVCLLAVPASVNGDLEIKDPTHTCVAVKKHPKTGKPYVTILPENVSSGDAEIISASRAASPQPTPARPDYRMLDWKVKNGAIPYDGPSSNRTKVYVFAASIATLGVVSGAAVLAVAPATAAATGASASGAGIYAAGGAAVTAGTVSTALIQTKPDGKQDDYDHYSESKEIN
jgi:hypothetical protein